MLGSLTGMFNKLKDNKVVQNIAGNITHNYSKLKGHVLSNYHITQIIPQIYHIPFPDNDHISPLTAHIGQSEFQIWNTSEYKYDKQIQATILNVHEQGQIHHLCFSMYSNPPFYELILAINNIHSFIQCNKNNKVYVHCQDNKVRSAILLSCYIYKYLTEDISEAILLVNKALEVNLQDQGKKSTYKNLHILFKNFVNYHNDPHIIHRHKLKLLKLIVSNPPSLKINNQTIQVTNKLRVCIEIKCGEQTITKQVYRQGSIEGNMLCALFSKDVVVGDQFLVIVKYLHEGKAYNMFRIQLNTNFIYHCFARIYEQDIDNSSFAKTSQELMHIDFIFQPRLQFSKLALLQPHPTLPKAQQKTISEKTKLKEEKTKESLLQQTEKAQQQAIASLNEDLNSQPSSTQDMDKQMQQKMLSLKSVVVPQLPVEQQQQQQDLQDYLSKLQEQA